MKIKIDSRGRFTIPKSIRDLFKLEPGTAFVLDVRSSDLVLTPLNQDSMIIEKDGLLVYVGHVPADFDWDNLMENEREHRMNQIWNSGNELDD
jgi:AbrB family looped-hinge helix DNA binding protein